jgi:hypothetical protein
MLSKSQRAEILIYCLKKLHPQCVKRKNLFSDMDAEDLVEEVGVHIWIALMRYRKKPYRNALKLAFATGRNRLISIVRTRMTVVKRGAKAKFISEDVDDLYWLSSRSIHSNGVEVVNVLETIGSIAILRVGLRRSPALVKALMYDWRRKPSAQQKPLMEALDRNRIGVRKLVAEFIVDIQRQIPPGQYVPEDHVMEKVEGRWKRKMEEMN